MELMSVALDDEESIIKKAVETLANGGLIVYPTDTLYGIGADAASKESVEKVFKVKRRSEDNPLSVLVSDFRMLERYACMDEKQKELVHELLPGRVSVILESVGGLAPNLSKDGSLAFRIPLDHLAIRIAERFGRPITSTSANLHGHRMPENVKGIIDQLGENIAFYIDAGDLTFDASTLVDLRGSPRVLREGMDLGEVKKVLR